MKILLIFFLFILNSNFAKASITGIFDESSRTYNNFHIKTCNFFGQNYDDTPEKKPDIIISPIWVPLSVTSSLIGLPLEAVGSSKGYFYSSNVIPSKSKLVVLKNLSFGTDKNNVAKVYSIRKYNSENGSEVIKLTKGLTHSNKYFIVNNGNNRISYEIINKKNKLVLDSGEFNVYVSYTTKC